MDSSIPHGRDVGAAHERALAGVCSHGGHGWDGDTCSDIDDALAAPSEACGAEPGEECRPGCIGQAAELDTAEFEREPDYEHDSDYEPLVFADESE